MSRLAGAAIAGLALAAGCVGALGGADAELRPPTDVDTMAAEYRGFLDAGRVPADTVAWALARSPGWRVVDPFDTRAPTVSAGDRLVFIDRDRSALFVVVGEQPLVDGGARMVCGHIDTPGPKLHAEALIEADGEARFAAHIYGGGRVHHWLGVPLGLVGRVARAGGGELPVRLGFEGEDPFSFFVVDGKDDRLVAVAATTEQGKGDQAGARLTVARALHERYEITADDLRAAELYLVPAWPAREVGLDRALIGAHGQDDRINSYAAWRALIDVGTGDAAPAHTAAAWLVDREEVGSTGTTGARSRFLEMSFAWLLRAQGARADERNLARAFAATIALSTDTPASLNPNFPEPHIERLAPRLHRGPVIFPYAGRDGKDGSNIARAEIIRTALDLFEAAGVPIQVAELGKVEAGGGGTVSSYLAERGMDVLDIGISIVGMHSTMELTSKQDLWWGYQAYRAWLVQ